jgi:hypothetical protein
MSERMRYAYTYGPGRPLTVTIVTPENMAAVMLVMAAEYAADAAVAAIDHSRQPRGGVRPYLDDRLAEKIERAAKAFRG